MYSILRRFQSSFGMCDMERLTPEEGKVNFKNTPIKHEVIIFSNKIMLMKR
jgi:hypothetical protein